jgi:Fe-S cluster assembly protein SufD
MTAIADALELGRVESHLNPLGSFDLGDHPMPTGREEIWRFSPLKRLQPLLVERDDESHVGFDAEAPESVTVQPITPEEARALAVEAPVDRISALAVVHARRGAMLVDVPAEADLDKPVVVTVSGTSGRSAQGHLVVRVGAHARATVIVRHVGGGSYAAKTDVITGAGSHVTFVSLQEWDDDAVHGGQTSIQVGQDAEVRSVSVSFGGNVVRLQEDARYAGPGGSIEMLGLYFADAGQHIEHRLFVDHTAPHTKSRVTYKGALQGQGAHTVWIGNVLIRKQALGIDTYEENRNLVLTDGCQADSVPNLEIETGEIVGAGHASATGRFDDEQLFYLRSRGISEREAHRLVVHGFFNDLIRRIAVPELEERLAATVEAELAKNVLKDDA